MSESSNVFGDSKSEFELPKISSSSSSSSSSGGKEVNLNIFNNKRSGSNSPSPTSTMRTPTKSTIFKYSKINSNSNSNQSKNGSSGNGSGGTMNFEFSMEKPFGEKNSPKKFLSRKNIQDYNGNNVDRFIESNKSKKIALNVNMVVMDDNDNDNNEIITNNNGKSLQIESSTPTTNSSNIMDSLNSTPKIDQPSSIKVAVRMRPLSALEKKNQKNPRITDLILKDNKVMVTSKKEVFEFDHCLDSSDEELFNYASQEFVFRKMGKPLMEYSFQGYNTCLFAYGQSGSGKTYTMMGTDENPGIIPRFLIELFRKINQTRDKEFIVNISFMEIYNEKIHDLLVDEIDSLTKKLRIREHPQTGPYVEDLTVYTVENSENALELLKNGLNRRTMASTNSNEFSSRSHTIFSIILVQNSKLTDGDGGNTEEVSCISKINLVDLAGSERIASVNTDRFREGTMINKSLLTLGKVITQLADNSSLHVPYRDSMLTYLLKDSLGGNSRTSMIATISPAKNNLDETISTLRYASKAQKIINIVRVNEDPKVKIIDGLLKQISFLKKEANKNKLNDLENSGGDSVGISPSSSNGSLVDKKDAGVQIDSIPSKTTQSILSFYNEDNLKVLQDIRKKIQSTVENNRKLLNEIKKFSEEDESTTSSSTWKNRKNSHQDDHQEFDHKILNHLEKLVNSLKNSEDLDIIISNVIATTTTASTTTGHKEIIIKNKSDDNKKQQETTKSIVVEEKHHQKQTSVKELNKWTINSAVENNDNDNDNDGFTYGKKNKNNKKNQKKNQQQPNAWGKSNNNETIKESFMKNEVSSTATTTTATTIVEDKDGDDNVDEKKKKPEIESTSNDDKENDKDDGDKEVKKDKDDDEIKEKDDKDNKNETNDQSIEFEDAEDKSLNDIIKDKDGNENKQDVEDKDNDDNDDEKEDQQQEEGKKDDDEEEKEKSESEDEYTNKKGKKNKKGKGKNNNNKNNKKNQKNQQQQNDDDDNDDDEDQEKHHQHQTEKPQKLSNKEMRKLKQEEKKMNKKNNKK